MRVLIRPLSNRALVVACLLMTALFILLRWQPGPWLAGLLRAELGALGVPLEYREARLRGWTLELRDARIGTGGSLRFEAMRAAPDPGSLVRLAPGARVEARLQENGGIKTRVLLRDGRIFFEDLYAELPASWVRDRLAAAAVLPADLAVSGTLALRGEGSVDRASGLPASGRISLDWPDAGADAFGRHQPLGAYRATLESQEQAWQWRLGGGTALKIEGGGRVIPAGPDMRRWKLAGSIALSPGPGLDEALAGLIGTGLRLRLEGTLASPRAVPAAR